MLRKKIISLHIDTGTYTSFLGRILELGELNKSSYVCVSNVHMCIEAYDDIDFAAIVNSADLVTPDGMPLAKAIHFIYGKQQDRVAGMDVLPDLLSEAEERGLSCYIYGGSDKMLINSEHYIKEKFPALRCGYHSPPFRTLTDLEKQEDIDRINGFGAHLVFVALGCPKQERWMSEMKGHINACMLGIGGALPVMIGMQDRAPSWMQKSSLEWLYRLGQEPKRLFKRYAYTNTKFVYLLMKQKVGLLK